ncbi:MAG: HAMP domain-containing histidine kinase [Hyphomicrobiales bacterium]|nr:MAG: HAMP domain-containing histidine kinase [Hyphomicrobiales bacterium]
MVSVSLTRSTSIRLAAFYICLFLVSFFGANALAYNLVASYLYERLDSNVMERFREISSAYEVKGIDGAIAMISSHSPAITGRETIYTLRDPENELLIGNVDLTDIRPGFSTRAPTSHEATLKNYRLYRSALGIYDLTVGVSYDDTNHLRRIALVSFGLATAIVLAVGLGAAAVLASRMRRRISMLSDTMKAVGAGQLSTRLPVSSRRDDIDTLAVEINVALVQLQASVSAMTQVTTDIAHDLKTPIGRLFLVLDAASEKDDLASVKPLIEKAMNEISNITATFEGLLRISQIESGVRGSRFTKLDLTNLLSEIFGIYRDIVEDAERSLTFVPTHQSAYIFGDGDLLKQMCVNLIVNAMRHTRSGASIVVATSSDSRQSTIVISDDGPGIPEEERSNVFKRFYRLEKSRTTEGTGLGLSLVKAICDLHGATVSLGDNKPGLIVQIDFPVLR